MSKRVRLHEIILTGLEVLLITVPHENIPWIFIILNNLTFSHANWKAMINSSKRHELSGHHRMNQSYAIQSHFSHISIDSVAEIDLCTWWNFKKLSGFHHLCLSWGLQSHALLYKCRVDLTKPLRSEGGFHMIWWRHLLIHILVNLSTSFISYFDIVCLFLCSERINSPLSVFQKMNWPPQIINIEF